MEDSVSQLDDLVVQSLKGSDRECSDEDEEETFGSESFSD
jgi:hypothetical protein